MLSVESAVSILWLYGKDVCVCVYYAKWLCKRFRRSSSAL
jgi:hypothetical protein